MPDELLFILSDSAQFTTWKKLAKSFRMYWASQVAQWLKKKKKNPPIMQEMRVRSLDGEDPLEEEMAIHSGILAWKIPWTGSLVAPCPWGYHSVRYD